MIDIMSPEIANDKRVKWIKFPCSQENQWICNANKITMDFGDTFESIFLRWAVTINGLHVASEKYKEKEWLSGNRFFLVQGIRNSLDGSGPELVNVRVWKPDMAAQIHETSIPMLSAWAFCNMYSCLEEFIFKIFRAYLEAYPLIICKGKEFQELRKAYHNKNQNDEMHKTWRQMWSKRLETWHRNKLYDGIEKVFNYFISETNLKIPEGYKEEYNYSDIAKTLGGIALIRNCFIHGVTTVPQELEEFCSDFRRVFFNFKAGEKFQITVHELATFEYFMDTFTQTLNTSFFELAHPQIKNLAT